MMRFPYTVTVTTKNNDLNVSVVPSPVATKEEYIPVVAGTVQKLLMDDSIRNTILGRAKLKKELTDALRGFHKQDMIKPKDKP